MSRTDRASVAELAQRLIRFNTTNPPGNERACIEFITRLLGDAGLETTTKALDPARPNLLARLRGRGEQPPLLLHGHVDVVPAARENWQHDPFGGEIVDGELWGRGAVDMKGGVAMMLSAILRIAASRAQPPGDVIFAALSDEEGGSGYGARFLVERHPELFDGVEHAIGEFGAIARAGHAGNVYLVPVAEKQWCSLKVRLRGSGGHGAMPVRGGSMARLGNLLTTLESERLPLYVGEVSRQMIDDYAAAVEPSRAENLRSLTIPALSDGLLDEADGALALFDAALHNTVTPTVIRAGDRDDAIPDTIELSLDGRVLPGRTPQHLVDELTTLAGQLDLEITHVDQPATETVDMSLLPTLGAALRQVDPGACLVPMLNPGVTDGRFLAQLGIQHHGFLPMQLPDPAPIIRTMHGVDERVAISALEFGTSVYEALLLAPLTAT